MNLESKRLCYMIALHQNSGEKQLSYHMQSFMLRQQSFISRTWLRWARATTQRRAAWISNESPGRWTVASLPLVTPTLSQRNDTTEEIKLWVMKDERKQKYNNKRINLLENGQLEEIWELTGYKTKATAKIPTFSQPGERSSHMHCWGFAEELAFTSCRTGERGRDRGSRRGGGGGGGAGTVTHPQP